MTFGQTTIPVRNCARVRAWDSLWRLAGSQFSTPGALKPWQKENLIAALQTLRHPNQSLSANWCKRSVGQSSS